MDEETGDITSENLRDAEQELIQQAESGLDELFRFGFDFLQPYPYLQALLLVVTFVVLAKLVDRVTTGVIRRLAARTDTVLDDRFIDILHRPVIVSISMMGLILATYRVDLDPYLQNLTLNIIDTILIFVWVIFGVRLSKLLLDAMVTSDKRFGFAQPATKPLLSNAFAIILFVTAIYAILVAWDINVTGLVASAGIVGLALSFAAQDTLSNLFAGVAILADRPYAIGDYINLDSGERGQVTHIGLRSTRLMTRDDVEITVPNSVMGSAKIINESGGTVSRYRVRAKVGVAYGSDIDKVQEILLGVVANNEKICQTPEPRVRFRVFGDSSLDFELLAWIFRPADRGLVLHEINCEIYKAFDMAGIQIPFPQRDLYIKEMPSEDAGTPGSPPQ